MTYNIPCRYEDCILEVIVKTTQPVKVRLIVFDANQQNTQFTNRYMTVDGQQAFRVRMPLSPNMASVTVYNEAVGNKKQGEDKTIEVLSVTKQALTKRMDVVDFNNPVISGFVKFAQRFCYNAGVLPANKIYYSSNNQFKIKYSELIPERMNKKLGKMSSTPAQTSMNTGMIEISKKSFVGYTVPMRMAIVLHEFSHYYMNSNIEDEEEADLNALLIYLSLGYPRIEASQAFLDVFIETDTPENKRRWDVIYQFIKNFEKANIIIE